MTKNFRNIKKSRPDSIYPDDSQDDFTKSKIYV